MIINNNGSRGSAATSSAGIQLNFPEIAAVRSLNTMRTERSLPQHNLGQTMAPQMGSQVPYPIARDFAPASRPTPVPAPAATSLFPLQYQQYGSNNFLLSAYNPLQAAPPLTLQGASMQSSLNFDAHHPYLGLFAGYRAANDMFPRHSNYPFLNAGADAANTPTDFGTTDLARYSTPVARAASLAHYQLPGGSHEPRDFLGSSTSASTNSSRRDYQGSLFGYASLNDAQYEGQAKQPSTQSDTTYGNSTSNTRYGNPSQLSTTANGITNISTLGQDQKRPSTLVVPTDSTFFDPIHQFIRTNCIQVFAATQEDMKASGRGAHPTKVGRVGFRCYFCRHVPKDQAARQAVCFPSKRDTIFESIRNFQRTHMPYCPCMPPDVKAKYDELVSKQGSMKKRSHKYMRAYYAEAASWGLGIVDTHDGLMFGAPPNENGIPSRNLQALLDAAEDPAVAASYRALHTTSESETAIELKKFEHVASETTRRVIANARRESSILMHPEDFPTVSDFEFILIHQVTPFPSSTPKRRREGMDKQNGICCKYCIYSGEEKNQFPVKLNTSGDTNLLKKISSHLMKCPHVPQDLKDAFAELKILESEYSVKSKRGSVQRLLKKIWMRLKNYYEINLK